jgi:ESCRT-II complex subunit VPS36
LCSSILICEGGTLGLTGQALNYKAPAAKIKWSLNLDSIKEIKREPSGYLTSGKILISIFEVKNDSGKLKIWTCQVCEEINESEEISGVVKCKICGSIQKGKLLKVKIEENLKETTVKKEKIQFPWICEVCEGKNEGNQKNCEICGFSKTKTKEDENENENDGKWTCPDCTFINFNPKFDNCQVCNFKVLKEEEIIKKFKFSFRSGGSTIFYKKLLQIWREGEKKKKLEFEEETVTVGISGLLKRQEERNLAAEVSLSTAFSDLDALMRSAGEMVQLAGKISEKIVKNKNMNKSDESDFTIGQRNTFNDLIESLGIETLTNHSDSTLQFYQSIAHGVSVLIQAMISKTGTRVYSLTDVYCLYNRTRTTGSLIAPADLLKGTQQLSRLDLPIRLHKFTEKGMLCLVPAQDVDPHHLYILIQQILKEKGTFLTAVDLAEKLKISLFLAGQQLMMAEAAGKIVRDAKRKDLPAFYSNIFNKDIN